MASLNEKFQQAAWAYLVYGLLYLAGAIYLVQQGFGIRGMQSGAGIGWFIFGGLFIIVIPLLLYRTWKFRVLFAKILTILVAIRAFGVGRVIIAPSVPTVPLPGGGELSMRLGAGVFFLITLLVFALLVRAAWLPHPTQE